MTQRPDWRWETASARATPHIGKNFLTRPELQEDARAESFSLHFEDGRVGQLECGLRGQWADETAITDPDLADAVRAWLIARGARTIHLLGPRGQTIAEGKISPVDLFPPAAKASARIITLAPSNAEMVEALGCFSRVVACEESTDWPPEAADCVRLGPDLGPDLDRVVELDPDLVVASLTVPGMERVVVGLRARGLPTIVLAPRGVDDVIADLRRLGAALGVDARAALEGERMEAERAELLARRPLHRARVYLEWWPRPMFTPGADCYSNELIALAGGVNVFGERTGSSLRIEVADVVAADPDLCFVSWCGVPEAKLDPQNLIERAGMSEVRAIRDRRVYALDEAYMGRPGPRVLEAARRMSAVIAELR